MFVDFLAGDLKPPNSHEFDNHLLGCAACREELKTYQSTLSLAKSLPPLVPPLSILDRLRKKVAENDENDSQIAQEEHAPPPATS